jgi:hypothetical protein
MPKSETTSAANEMAISPENCAPAVTSPDHWWVSADYLLAWTRSKGVPPLVTTSPAGTPQATAGVLGQNTTTVLFGDKNVDGGYRSGVQLGAGFWIDPERTVALDLGVFMLESRNALFFAGSQNGNPILARPFTTAIQFSPAPSRMPQPIPPLHSLFPSQDFPPAPSLLRPVSTMFTAVMPICRKSWWPATAAAFRP